MVKGLFLDKSPWSLDLTTLCTENIVSTNESHYSENCVDQSQGLKCGTGHSPIVEDPQHFVLWVLKMIHCFIYTSINIILMYLKLQLEFQEAFDQERGKWTPTLSIYIKPSELTKPLLFEIRRLNKYFSFSIYN
jgi:hypothetical protein